MIRVRPVGRLALFLALGGTSPCHAATEEAKAPDYLEWRLLNRNYFLYNDYRRADAGRGYRKEWAHGLIADLESAYTPGRVGFGLDLHGFAGFKLDGGRGHAGTGLLPLDSSGDNASEYSDAGAALKLRLGESLLKVGEMTVETPVFDTSDKRLQPQYARGFFLQSDDLDRVRIQAGRFTAFKEQASSSGHGDFDGYGASTAGSAIGFAGASLAASDNLSGSLFAAQLDNVWRQVYLNMNLQRAAFSLDGNLYRTRDQGRSRAGAIDTLAYSLQLKYRVGAQGFSLAYQRVHGDTPFDFVGGDSIYLANSIKYADFNGPGERSWQARYDLDLAPFGLPGLSFMARYVSGRAIDGSHAPAGGALADIVDKRRYLLGVQLWMALVATLLASLTLLQLTSVWLLLGLTLCMGIGTALMMPAWSATTPELVGKDELPAAVALSSVGVNLARAVGPAIAGVLVSLVGPWLTFALNALSFFAVIAVLLAWKREAVPSVLPAERLFGALRAGWRYSRSSRPLQSVLVRAVAFFLGASAGMSLLPLIVRGELHGNAMDFGLLLGSVGVGAVLGAAFLPRLRERLGSDRLVLLSSVLYALVLVALALLRNLYLLVPVMLLSGAAWIAVLSSLQVAAQTSVPAWVRARALAVYILVFFGSMAAGGALWGLLASHLSITFALLCASAALLLGLFASLRCRLPVTEAEDLAPSLHWPAPLVDEEVDQERGPVMVTLEYDIDPQDAAAFQAAMVEVRAMRRRNGAVSWGLVQDSGNRRLWLEFFIDESWLEHLRHHQRVTRGELRVEAAARRFQSAGVEVRIRHYLHGAARP